MFGVLVAAVLALSSCVGDVASSDLQADYTQNILPALQSASQALEDLGLDIPHPDPPLAEQLRGGVFMASPSSFSVSLGRISVEPVGGYAPVYEAIAGAWDQQGFKFDPDAFTDQTWQEYLNDERRTRPSDPKLTSQEQRGYLRPTNSHMWVIFTYARQKNGVRYFEIEAHAPLRRRP